MKRDSARIAGLILAAGYSSRMGDFKPLLPIGGSTAIEMAVISLLGAGVRSVSVVVGWRADELAPVLNRLGVGVVFNPDYQAGMYSSVMAGVGSLDPDAQAFLLLPSDTPLVKPRTIRELIRRFVESEAPIVYPSFLRRRGHPPVVSTHCLAGTPYCDPPGGLRTVLSPYEGAALDLEVADQGTIMDMDTPSDYQALLAYSSRARAPTPMECEAILGMLRVPQRVVAHSRTVAAVACELASQLKRRGLALDLDLISAASLLHDVARGRPRHSREGARAIAALGYPRVAACISSHMDIEPGPAPGLVEEQLLYLADKLVQEDRVVSLQERLAAATQRFGSQPVALAAAEARLKNAEIIMKRVEDMIGSPLELSKLAVLQTGSDQ